MARPRRGDPQPSQSSVMLVAEIIINGRPVRPRWETGFTFSIDEPPETIKAALNKALVDARALIHQELGFK